MTTQTIEAIMIIVGIVIFLKAALDNESDDDTPSDVDDRAKEVANSQYDW